MSVSVYVYTGFYIQLNKEVFLKEINIKCCKNKNCKLYQKEVETNFCGNCGAKVVEDSVLREIDAEYISNLISEKYESEFHYAGYSRKALLPEFQVSYSKKTNIMYDGEQLVIPVSKIDSELERLNTKSIFKDILDYLNDTYGEKTAELVYGVVGYANY